jgi:hypothetical protein
LVRRAVSQLTRKIGHRGSVLLFFGFLDVVYGVSLWKPPAESEQSSTLLFIKGVAPLWAWATLWGLVGVGLLVGAFQRVDRWAFAVGVALKILWGLTFLLGWMFVNLDRGWVSAAIWLALAVMLYVISTWPEPVAGGGPWTRPSS